MLNKVLTKTIGINDLIDYLFSLSKTRESGKTLPINGITAFAMTGDKI